MMEKKTTYKIFTIADYDEEAAYLRKMHKAGQQLAKVNLSPFLLAAKYTFEKCLPEDYSYQLDFQPLEKAEQAHYFQLFDDYGWEHVLDFNSFSYFRKPVSKIKSEEEFEIYNDSRSKLGMMKRIVDQRLLPVIAGTLALSSSVWMIMKRHSSFSLLTYIILVIVSTLLLLLLGILIHIVRRFLIKRMELTNLDD